MKCHNKSFLWNFNLASSYICILRSSLIIWSHSIFSHRILSSFSAHNRWYSLNKEWLNILFFLIAERMILGGVVVWDLDAETRSGKVRMGRALCVKVQQQAWCVEALIKLPGRVCLDPRPYLLHRNLTQLRRQNYYFLHGLFCCDHPSISTLCYCQWIYFHNTPLRWGDTITVLQMRNWTSEIMVKRVHGLRHPGADFFRTLCYVVFFTSKVQFPLTWVVAVIS